MTNPIETMSDEQLREEAKKRVAEVKRFLAAQPEIYQEPSFGFLMTANQKRMSSHEKEIKEHLRWWRALDQAYREAQP